MPQKPKPVAKIPGMPPRKKVRTLATTRLVALIEQLLNEIESVSGKQRKVTDVLGIESTLPSKLKENPYRNVDVQTVEQVVASIGIDAQFFSVPGTTPNYREYMPDGRSAVAQYLKAGKSSPGTARAPSWDGHESALSSYGEQTAPNGRRGGRSAKPAQQTNLPQAIIEAFAEMNASLDERQAFAELLKDYNFPFLNRSLARAFVIGLRKGKRLNQRVDEALEASIDEEVGRRKPLGDDNGQ
jgi:hypothetical protein